MYYLTLLRGFYVPQFGLIRRKLFKNHDKTFKIELTKKIYHRISFSECLLSYYNLQHMRVKEDSRSMKSGTAAMNWIVKFCCFGFWENGDYSFFDVVMIFKCMTLFWINFNKMLFYSDDIMSILEVFGLVWMIFNTLLHLCISYKHTSSTQDRFLYLYKRGRRDLGFAGVKGRNSDVLKRCQWSKIRGSERIF